MMKTHYSSSGKDNSSSESENESESKSTDLEYADRKMIPESKDYLKTSMSKDTSIPVDKDTESSSKDSDDTDNGNRVQTSPAAWSQMPKKRKVVKEEVNLVMKTQPNSLRHESQKKAKSRTLNTSETDLNVSTVNKEKNGKQTSVGRVQGKSLEKRQRLKSSGGSKLHKTVDKDRTLASKSPVYSWSFNDEMLLASCFLRDFKSDGSFPPKQNENYWKDLSEELKGRLDVNLSRSQIYEKHRRMKARYNVLTERMLSPNSKQPMYKSADEEKLYGIFQQIWGHDEPQRLDNLNQKPMDTHKEEKDDNEVFVAEKDGKEISGEKSLEARILASDFNSIKSKPNTKLVSAPKSTTSEVALRAWGDNRNNVAGESLLPVFNNNPELSNENTLYIKLQAANCHLIEEMHKSFATALKEENTKFHTLVENSLKQCDEKFRWLFDSVTTFMPLAGAGTTSSCIWGDISDVEVPFNMSDPEDSKSVYLLQQMLEQQSLEIEVHVTKMTLLQEVLHHKLRVLNPNLTRK